MEKRKLILINSKKKKVALNVEIADAFFKQLKGLMFRNSLADYEGMLFIFKDEKPRSLWMLFTKLSLEALFFDKDGKLVDIIPMQSCKSLFCSTYKSKQSARYILEVNSNFSRLNAIKEGCIMQFL